VGDGDMIVLDQRRAVEAKLVVWARARARGVFLDRAQERRRLRVQTMRASVCATAADIFAVQLAIPLGQLMKLAAAPNHDFS
jgi:hypothetical protein